jgi:hypothetical protein
MTLDDLKQRLSDAGLGPMDGRGPYVFEIGPTLLAIRGYRIQVKDGRFRVGQTERGEWTSVDLETVDDNEACRFFLDQIMRRVAAFPHLHPERGRTGGDYRAGGQWRQGLAQRRPRPGLSGRPA